MKMKPTKEELRDMRDKGMTLYQISRKYGTTIPEIFKLEKYYGIIPKTLILKKCYNISKEDLESMYIDEGMVQERIAEEIGCSASHVSRMLDYYNIPTRGRGKFTPQQRDIMYDKIEHMYNEGMTQEQIAEKVGYSAAHVGIIIHERGVQTRGRGRFDDHQRSLLYDNIVQMYNNGETEEEIAEKVGYSISSVCTILQERGVQTRGSGRFDDHQRSLIHDNIVQMYKDGKSTYEIAEKVGYSQGYVSRILQEYGVQTRGPTGTITTQKLSLITADKLQECIDKGMNQYQIAEHFNVHDATIYKLANKFGIPGMVGNYRCTTPEHLEWRREVLERDNYTCQLCGSHDNLEGHHIYPFRDYPERQFDIDNGATLCHGCHYKVTGHESEYIVELEDIVLRDRHIGDDIKPGIDFIDYLARKFDQKGVDIFGGELPTHEYTSIYKEE